MKFRENEDAVSPVIGVILMVAITVILAAVIAAFVFGMGSNVQTQKTVGLNLQKDITDGNDADLKITILGGPDLPTLRYLKVTFDGDEDGAFYTIEGQYTMKAEEEEEDTKGGQFSVGAIFTAPEKLKSGEYTRVIVVGHFSDGQDQLLADKHL